MSERPKFKDGGSMDVMNRYMPSHKVSFKCVECGMEFTENEYTPTSAAIMVHINRITGAKRCRGEVIPYNPNITSTKAFWSAYKKGYIAGRDGILKRECPYPDIHGIERNNVTFSRAFIGYWNSGWEEGREEYESELLLKQQDKCGELD